MLVSSLYKAQPQFSARAQIFKVLRSLHATECSIRVSWSPNTSSWKWSSIDRTGWSSPANTELVYRSEWILNLLQTEDDMMVDQRFTIEDKLTHLNVRLKIPSFLGWRAVGCKWGHRYCPMYTHCIHIGRAILPYERVWHLGQCDNSISSRFCRSYRVH